MAQLERGFKSWAERVALRVRKDLHLPPHAPLDAAKLAEYLEVRLCDPRQIPGLPKTLLDQLLEHDPWGWSAVSVLAGDQALVIYNPRHSRGRQASDITHELAHLILDHQPSTMIMSQDGTFAMRSYNQQQEDEANWLAWSLLLPREALVRCASRELSPAQIAAEYGVTETLASFRLQITGVKAQFRALAGRREAVGVHKKRRPG